eukprot:1233067-Prymnesium_polylepis.1
MSGWDNLEGKNKRTGAQVVENAKLRQPVPPRAGPRPETKLSLVGRRGSHRTVYTAPGLNKTAEERSLGVVEPYLALAFRSHPPKSSRHGSAARRAHAGSPRASPRPRSASAPRLAAGLRPHASRRPPSRAEHRLAPRRPRPRRPRPRPHTWAWAAAQSGRRARRGPRGR